MSIEVFCPGCQSRLRIADESMGRKSRCPNCLTVFMPEPPFGEAPSFDPAPVDSYWATGHQPGAGQRVDAHTNPYAPSFSEPDRLPESGVLEPSPISIDEVISKSWLIFKKHWVMACAVVIIIGTVNGGVRMVQQVLPNMLRIVINDEMVAIVLLGLIGIVGMVLQLWLQLGQTMVMLDIARGRRIEISRLFAAGPFLLQGVVAMLLISVIVGLIGATLIGVPLAIGAFITRTGEGAAIGAGLGVILAIVPILFVVLSVSQHQPLIVDRHLNAVAALKTSYDLTRGNKFTLMLIGVILTVMACAALLVGLMLFCLGVLPAMIGIGAYSSIAFVVVYLSMSGQAVVVPGSEHDLPSHSFPR